MQEEKNKLYVGNLPYTVDSDALAEIFGAIDGVEVTSANVIMDRVTNRSKGFGFVVVADEQQAEIAIKEMNGKEVEGREIFVNVARPQEKRNDRDSRGGSSFNRSYR